MSSCESNLQYFYFTSFENKPYCFIKRSQQLWSRMNLKWKPNTSNGAILRFATNFKNGCYDWTQALSYTTTKTEYYPVRDKCMWHYSELISIFNHQVCEKTSRCSVSLSINLVFQMSGFHSTVVELVALRQTCSKSETGLLRVKRNAIILWPRDYLLHHKVTFEIRWKERRA